jgi:DNA invertase Pin-like site-specific DNA recombinase
MSNSAEKRPRAYSYLRMSTDIQLKGDSQRRQNDAAREYAEKHGLDLVDQDRLEDIGISAYTGANIKDGNLGRFLTAINSGSVERGSYLLVESLDRLTRQKMTPSVAIFHQIIQAGVNIVNLVRIHQDDKIVILVANIV